MLNLHLLLDQYQFLLVVVDLVVKQVVEVLLQDLKEVKVNLL